MSPSRVPHAARGRPGTTYDSGVFRKGSEDARPLMVTMVAWFPPAPGGDRHRSITELTAMTHWGDTRRRVAGDRVRTAVSSPSTPSCAGVCTRGEVEKSHHVRSVTWSREATQNVSQIRGGRTSGLGWVPVHCITCWPVTMIHSPPTPSRDRPAMDTPVMMGRAGARDGGWLVTHGPMVGDSSDAAKPTPLLPPPGSALLLQAERTNLQHAASIRHNGRVTPAGAGRANR